MPRFWLTILVLLLINVAQADVYISEIAWSGTVSSGNDEWIELYNSGEEEVSLENWTLKSEDGVPDILLKGSIGAGKYFLLERTDDSSVPDVFANQLYKGALGNDGEELVLKNAAGEELNRTPNGTWTAGENEEKRSMMLINGSWTTYRGEEVAGIYGTPGARNILPAVKAGFQSGEVIKIRITEISPIACGEKEWLELDIWTAGKAVDLSQWKLRRGTSEKSFAQFIDNSELHSGGLVLSDCETGLDNSGFVGLDEVGGSGHLITAEEVVYLGTDEDKPLRVSLFPSPISLPDDGGTLEIIDEKGEVRESVKYMAAKSGEKNEAKWYEIWERDGEKWWPLVSWEDAGEGSRGMENKQSPALPEEIEIVINEIAPNRVDKIDFVEFLVREFPEDKRMASWSLQHNGTELFASDGEELKKGELITLKLEADKIQEDPERWQNKTIWMETGRYKSWESSTRNGLNGSSGTLELNIWNGTSWEQNEDFVCWAEEDLSENEQNRLENHTDDWDGRCVSVKDNITNESLARQPLSGDNDSENDFFKHFNGTPGIANFAVNAVPVAKIMVQGGKRLYETSLNLTGLSDDEEMRSYDPDGEEDLKEWRWEIEGKSCGDYIVDNWEWSATRKGLASCEEESAKANPGLIYFNFNAQEKFSVKLMITDYSGASGENEVELDRDPFRVGGSGGNAFSKSIEKLMAKEFGKEEKSSNPLNVGVNRDEAATDDFFDDFIAAVDWSEIVNSVPPKIVEQKSERKVRFARDRVAHIPKSRLRKNIGLVLLV